MLSNPAKRAECDLTIDVTRGRAEGSGTAPGVAPRFASSEPSSVHDDDHEESRPITCVVDAVGPIASCRERNGNFTVGVEFYTVHFPPAQGTFVSIDA